MSGHFEGRVALVTGGSRGIGRATALRLASEGADLAISYGSQAEAAMKTAEEIKSLGRRCVHVQCDVSKPEQVDRMVRQTRENLGPIDYLAHCGAISTVVGHRELTYELWHETIDINLNGAFRVTFAVKDEMIERGFGRIVHISSIAALAPRKMQIHYSSAKAGVIALTRCCAEAFADHNVRVNCIAPGLIDTDMAYTLPPEKHEEIKAGTPMHRLGTAEEIANVVRFLLSDESSFMTGQTIVASGGRVMLP